MLVAAPEVLVPEPEVPSCRYLALKSHGDDLMVEIIVGKFAKSRRDGLIGQDAGVMIT